MKKLFCILLFLLPGVSALKAQTTVSIRLNAGTGEGAYVSDFYPVSTFNGYSDLVGVSWTQSGTPYAGRSYFRYDLSAIPANAIVTSASLSLYANPNATQPAHSTLTGSNASMIQQVTANWDVNTITWTNMPATTTTGQAMLGQSSTVNDDYLNIDVTSMVSQMVSNPATNYGFMLRLQSELPYRSLNFASISCTDTSKQPLLVINYVTNQNCTTFKLDTLTGDGAYVSDFYPVSNFNGYSDLVGVAWTQSGTPYVGRSYFRFDLSSIPANATVASAQLSLYANPTPTQPAHSTLSGANDAVIQKVTGMWDVNTITWTNKPGTTATGEVPLAASTSPADNYLNINVTNLTTSMISNPSTNYGYMLKLQNEMNYRSMNFASISCADTTRRPKLIVCYSVAIGMDEYTQSQPEVSLFPNPANNQVSITLSGWNGTDAGVEIYNVYGQLIKKFDCELVDRAEWSKTFDISEFVPGLYFITVNGSATKTIRFVKQ